MRRCTSSIRRSKTPPSTKSWTACTGFSESRRIYVNHWGRRQLAYPIGRREAGYYVVARFGAATEVLPEYERAIKLDDGVVRHLLTLFEHELGAPPMTEEEIAAAARRREMEDDEEEE